MLNTVTYKGTKLLPLYPSGTRPTPTVPIKLATGTYIAGQVVKKCQEHRARIRHLLLMLTRC
jgi:hypothetical protein